LTRPGRLNAVDFQMPGELAAAVRRANADPEVHVIVLQGAGRAFCSGYDLKLPAEAGQGTRSDAVWDPIRDYAMMKQFTDDYFTLWRSLKPTIAKVHGFAVAGGQRHRAALRPGDNGGQVARLRPLDPRRRRSGTHPRRSGRSGGLTATDHPG